MNQDTPIPHYKNDCFVTYNSPLRDLIRFRTMEARTKINDDLNRFVERHFEIVKERRFFKNLVANNEGALADDEEKPVPEFCNIEDVLQIIMEKAGLTTRASMIMTCRAWAVWLLPSGPGKLRYAHEETLMWGVKQSAEGLWVTAYRGLVPIAWEFQEDRRLMLLPTPLELPFLVDWNNIDPADFLDDEDIGSDDE